MQITPSTRALITGAGRGIGRALAQELARRGATLGLLARSAAELEALAAALPGEHHVLVADVADADAVRAAVDDFVARAGGLDLLVANAGLTHYEPFAAQSLEHVLQMSEVNWHGTLYTVHAGLPHMLRAHHGHVVIVSSGGGLRAFPQAAVYNGTKAAQRMFGDALRHELAGTGVSVTVVYPGEIATSLHEHEKATMPAWYQGGPKAAPPEKLAERIVAGVEADARAVYYPPIVRLLGALNAISPRASDALLRRLRGESVAPRRG
ncbi:MAG: SDR family NAD(P)-dependent oxidoreductase [Solirubrobacteraceae bacterium]